MASASAACGNSIWSASEIGFRYENLMVFQLQLTRDVRALPLTRDYMGDAERDLALRDIDRQPARRAKR